MTDIKTAADPVTEIDAGRDPRTETDTAHDPEAKIAVTESDGADDQATAASARTISWDDLVGAALLGTTRRPLETSTVQGAVGEAAATLPESDPAARLLDVVAMITVYRRAGARTPNVTTAIDPSPPETARLTPAPAASRLGMLLAAPGTVLLTEWLHVAAAAGVVAPPSLLPALLDLALRRPELTGAIVAVLGERGRWLAAARPDWEAAVSPAIAADAATDSDAVAPAENPVWTHGTSAERQAWFRALRARDPAAANALLAGLDWRREKGEDRVAFVIALRAGLSDADQAVLELARGDRRQDVRDAATDLLVDLHTSPYAAGLALIARDCLRLERRRLRRTIVVSFPDPATLDAAEVSAGLTPAGSGAAGSVSGGSRSVGAVAASAGGPGARAMHWLLTRAPLPVWEQAFGATPAELVDLPVADELEALVHTAWRAAARRQHNTAWAVALAKGAGVEHLAELLPAMPPGQRDQLVTRAVDSDVAAPGAVREPVLLALLQAIERPWTVEVAAALARWLASRDQKASGGLARGITELAAAALRPDEPTTAMIDAAAARQPEDSPWRYVIDNLADVLRLRHQMFEELR